MSSELIAQTNKSNVKYTLRKETIVHNAFETKAYYSQIAFGKIEECGWVQVPERTGSTPELASAITSSVSADGEAVTYSYSNVSGTNSLPIGARSDAGYCESVAPERVSYSQFVVSSSGEKARTSTRTSSQSMSNNLLGSGDAREKTLLRSPFNKGVESHRKREEEVRS